MKILVTGTTGQLGYDVVAELQKRNIVCIGTTREDFDLTDIDSTNDFIAECKPDAVIHCAAYTAVDQAEDEMELCRSVNVEGTANIARACKAIKAKLIYISTDYVFPGTGNEFYQEDDPTGPLSVYGQTKLAGEHQVRDILNQHFIVRVSWVFGTNGNNFVQTMLKLGEARKELNIVADQIGSPTYTADLAPLLCDMVMTDKYGTYHVTNEGICSWADFAKAIFKQAGLRTKVNPIPSSAYPTTAPRPLNSRLSKAKVQACGFAQLPPWQDALQRYLNNIR